jgi:hypothetical protein
MGLLGDNGVPVRTLTLGSAVLAVKLKLGSDHGVLSPTMHVKGRLSQHESTSIRHTRVSVVEILLKIISSFNKARASKVRSTILVVGSMPVTGVVSTGKTDSTGIVEHTMLIDKGGRVGSNTSRTAKRMDGIGEGIKGISVVKGLSTKHLEQGRTTNQGRAVVNVLVGLNNPDDLLGGVVQVNLDSVGRRTDRLVTSELELRNQVSVGTLRHLASLVSVQEDVINVHGSGNHGLVVGNGSRNGLSILGIASVHGVTNIITRGFCCSVKAVKGSHSPQALIQRTEVKAESDLVELKGNQRESQTGVGAKPELKRHVKSGLGEGVTGSTHLAGGIRVARTIDIRKGGVGDEGKLGGVTNHLKVSTLLLSSHSKLIPDMHPVTVMTVDSLSTNLHINLGDKLLTGEIQPASIHITSVSVTHILVNLGESHLKIGTVGKITTSGEGALNTATKIGLAVKGLFNRFNSEVSISLKGITPVSNVRIRSQRNVLRSDSNEIK